MLLLHQAAAFEKLFGSETVLVCPFRGVHPHDFVRQVFHVLHFRDPRDDRGYVFRPFVVDAVRYRFRFGRRLGFGFRFRFRFTLKVKVRV